MVKYYFKKGFSYILILSGIWFLIFGESLVDKEWIMHNHYFFERFIVASILCGVGFFYFDLIETRMEKYGRC